jgi:hypothetical protein
MATKFMKWWQLGEVVMAPLIPFSCKAIDTGWRNGSPARSLKTFVYPQFETMWEIIIIIIIIITEFPNFQL